MFFRFSLPRVFQTSPWQYITKLIPVRGLVPELSSPESCSWFQYETHVGCETRVRGRQVPQFETSLGRHTLGPSTLSVKGSEWNFDPEEPFLKKFMYSVTMPLSHPLFPVHTGVWTQVRERTPTTRLGQALERTPTMRLGQARERTPTMRLVQVRERTPSTLK